MFALVAIIFLTLGVGNHVSHSRLSGVFLASVLLITAIWSVLRLPPLHPLQLWSIPWALSSFGFALGLLPYIAISWLTVTFILGATAALGFGVAGGERLYRSRAGDAAPADTNELRKRLRWSALIAIGLTIVLLSAFLIQLTLRFGLRDALLADGEVRAAIGNGDFTISVKYLYANMAAIALTGAMAGIASSTRLSRVWLTSLLFLVAAPYFTTGRSNIFVAAAVAGVAFFMFCPRRPSSKRVAIGIVSSAIVGLTIFIAMGSLVGKVYEASPEFEQVPNFFLSHSEATALAIPYRYLSSSIPALELQVQQSSLLGKTHGCAGKSSRKPATRSG